MTKNKQKDNPKFGFLHGGEYFNYYQYKVTTEQASESIKPYFKFVAYQIKLCDFSSIKTARRRRAAPRNK